MEQKQLDFYAMMQEKKKAEEKVEPVEVKKEQAIEAPKEVKKEESKKTEPAKKTETKKVDKQEKQQKYLYPFSLYTEGAIVDISNYGFEDKEYTEKEITAIMLKHRHYEFGGEMTYSMIKEDNTLVATAKQYKKG